MLEIEIKFELIFLELLLYECSVYMI